MNKYFKLPLDYIGITTYFSATHPAIDLGWKDNPNLRIYSAYDGKVIENDYNDSTGYRVWIQSDIDDSRYLHRYCHLKEKSNLRVGDTINQGDLIGIMGSTGNSTGNHLHFDLWKCPKDYVMNWNDRSKYSVNPLLYCFLFDDQTQSSNNYGVTKVVGSKKKTNRNENKEQIEVLNTYLRARTSPFLKDNNILGYIDLGTYDVLEENNNDGYLWVKIDNNMWIANNEDTKLYKKDIKDCKELEEKVKLLEKENNMLKEELKDLEKFIAKKSDNYYIYLNSGEYVYYKKKM